MRVWFLSFMPEAGQNIALSAWITARNSAILIIESGGICSAFVVVVAVLPFRSFGFVLS